MRFSSVKRRAPVIQIVSLIDILAILLIFFIVTTTFKRDEPQLSIQLPEAKTAEEVPAQEQPILILVTKEGDIIIGEETYREVKTLVPVLQQLREEGKARLLAMKADEGAPFGSIIRVIDAMQEAGFTNLPTFAKPPEF